MPEVWEDVKVRQNGHGRFYATIPKTFIDAMNLDIDQVLGLRIIWRVKNGQVTLELEGLEKDG